MIPVVVWKGQRYIPTQKTRQLVFVLHRPTTFGKVRHVTSLVINFFVGALIDNYLYMIEENASSTKEM